MNAEMHQPWEETYRAAVLETDQRKLADKIDAANKILGQRLLELGSSSDRSQERQRVTDALRTLDMIRRIEFKVPA
jgi:hypothetical protein